MSDVDHLSRSQLTDLAEGRLPEAAAAVARSHVAACAQCAAELSELERVIGLMRGYAMESAPDYVIHRAIRLLRQRRPLAPPRRRLAALLGFDSRQQPTLATVRSGQPLARMLLFNAEPYAINLRIMPSGDSWSLTGQVLGPVQGGQLELLGPATALAMLNERGHFALSGLPAGIYALSLRLDDAEIDVANLELGP